MIGSSTLGRFAAEAEEAEEAEEAKEADADVDAEEADSDSRVCSFLSIAARHFIQNKE
jgi:hypothetical protein